MRIRIDLAYDGTHFSGWATQPNLRTVQASLEATISQVLRLTHNPATVCAGRTDAGVHARVQVVHVDLLDEVIQPGGSTLPTDEALRRWLPRALPDDIVIQSVHPAPDSFDARFSALKRRYVYRLWDSPVLDPLTRGFSVAFHHSLDVEAMVHASELLLGLHDFVAFCRPKQGGTSVRTLLELTPTRIPSQMIEITVVADAFCHSMVRSLVGGLVAIGRGLRDESWLLDHLNSDKRANDIVVMPAHGLTLEEVTYPPEEQLESRAQQARCRRDEQT